MKAPVNPISSMRRPPTPPSVIELLGRRVQKGDSPCTMVVRWPADSGLLDIACKDDDTSGRTQ